jgi:hypothetical protein
MKKIKLSTDQKGGRYEEFLPSNIERMGFDWRNGWKYFRRKSFELQGLSLKFQLTRNLKPETRNPKL